MGSPRRVVITGAGLLSPLGDSPQTLHAALLAGRSALGPITLFPTAGLRCTQAGEIPAFDPQALLGDRNFRPLDRISRLVAAAAGKALAGSGWRPEMLKQTEVGLVLGTMFCGVHTIAEFDRRNLTRGPSYASPLDFANTVINAAAGQTAIWHDLRGVNSTIAGGAASGVQALAYAVDLLRSGRLDAVLAGGADELCFETFYGFYRAGRLCGSVAGEEPEAPVPFDARRNGFALAEGAALLMLEEAESAARRGATVLAEIHGHGGSFDPSRGEDGERAARAVARAVGAALADAGIGAEQVGAVSAAADGGVLLDRHEAAGLAAAFSGGRAPIPVTAVKSMLGEALGASGPLQVIDLLETMRDGILPGIHGLEDLDPAFPRVALAATSESRAIDLSRAPFVLVDAVGFDGQCAALVLGPPGPARPSAGDVGGGGGGGR